MTERRYELLPTLRKPEDLMSWSQRLLVRLNAMIQTVERFFPGGRYGVLSPRIIKPTQLQLVDPRGLERILILSDSGTSQLIYSDGTTWRLASDDSEVT